MKMFRRIVIALLAFVVVLYFAGMAVLYVFQRNFQYEPEGSLLARDDARCEAAGCGLAVHGLTVRLVRRPTGCAGDLLVSPGFQRLGRGGVVAVDVDDHRVSPKAARERGEV